MYNLNNETPDFPIGDMLVDVDMFMQPMDLDSSKLYDSHWRSVLKSLNQVIQEIKTLGLSQKLQVINLDDHADLYNLPNKDCILLSGFNCFTSGGIVGVGWFLGVSTVEDKNNHRLSKIISHLFSRFGVGKSIRIVDDSLETIASLTFTVGTEVMPMSKEKNRSMQMLSVQGESTQTLK